LSSKATPSTPEVQPVAFKATKEKKEESTSSRLPIDSSKLDNAEMALIIKSFRQILKQRNGRDYKPRSKKVCYKCGKPGHFIAKCPISSDSDRGDDKKGKRKEKKRYYKKKGGDAHMCREWDSDESTTDSSSDEDAANIAVNKGLLFPNVGCWGEGKDATLRSSPFAAVAALTKTKRAGTPFASFSTRRRPAVTSPRSTASSCSEAHV
jgi:hypothetical protein